MAKIAYLFLTISAMAEALTQELLIYGLMYFIANKCFIFGIVTLIFLSRNDDRFLQVIKVTIHVGFWFLMYVAFLFIWSVYL
jgi:hypothetical protein